MFLDASLTLQRQIGHTTRFLEQVKQKGCPFVHCRMGTERNSEQTGHFREV